MSVFEVVAAKFLVRGRGFECVASIGDYHVALTELGAVYTMKCVEGGECKDCAEFSLNGEVSVFLPRRMFNCLACLLAEFYNSGLFNISLEGFVVTQRRAYIVPPMAKERSDPERFLKRARGILENYVLKLLAESFTHCCKF
ncbi:MAG: hypothetical protein ABWK05_06080 [Pyrobaculum sp.]